MPGRPNQKEEVPRKGKTVVSVVGGRTVKDTLHAKGGGERQIVIQKRSITLYGDFIRATRGRDRIRGS